MKKEYNIPQTEIVCPNMRLMDGTESIKSAVGNPGSVNEDGGVETPVSARRLYI